jgi:hypothetical protein
MATDPDPIPPKLLAPFMDADIRYVSIVTAQEIQLKNLRHPDAFSFSTADLALVMENSPALKCY